MSDIVLKIENVSKQYRLGEVGTGTISHDLNRWWHKVRGKEDPYLKIGETNDRTQKGDSEYAWALRDINFEVKQGEILGIIGKNGAGKSTLLKILSKVTGPTQGSIKSRGRIASLLEVGTGFHPELTGRENVYLNGAIMGMTKKEVAAKLDEIVDFAGVERYLDTPVKRYSSGMMVRLGFSVAAHLEPEILIIDEVLAVGDAEFQKKCLGKMGDVAKGGRTILFVSHNMASVQALCSKVIWMHQGKVKMEGGTSEVVNQYLRSGFSDKRSSEWHIDKEPNKDLFCKGFRVKSKDGNTILMKDHIYFEFDLVSKLAKKKVQCCAIIYNEDGYRITTLINSDYGIECNLKVGAQKFSFKMTNNNLSPGKYFCGFQIMENYGTEMFHVVDEALLFDIDVCDVTGNGVSLFADRGAVWPTLELV